MDYQIAVDHLKHIGAYPVGLDNYPDRIRRIYVRELYMATRGMTPEGYQLWRSSVTDQLAEYYRIRRRYRRCA